MTAAIDVAEPAKTTVDVAIVGAGMAGLHCAQQLQQAGYRVVIVEKSRGLGGRVATRRLAGTWADHGLRCLEEQGPHTQSLIQLGCDRALLHPWSHPVYQADSAGLLPGVVAPRYVATHGITAIAKAKAEGLDIRRGQRVFQLAATDEATWKLTLEPIASEPLQALQAKALVMTAPAPQTAELLAPLVDAGLSRDWVSQVQSIEYDPCITAIAAYTNTELAQAQALPWGGVQFALPHALAWIGLDNRKQTVAQIPVAVVQSSAQFAEQWFDEPDLPTVGRSLLTLAADNLSQVWLQNPAELQVHRWRYAFVRSPLRQTCLSTTVPLPLVCGGDWCGGTNLEAALRSGLAAANEVNRLLGDRPMPSPSTLTEA
ncbi:NAD(P)/FAD-dependent oxidoreductase [Leptolyngbya sp. AN02str]|uniref:NAD(P)/FAD-dependent oxidoreductase n=1 Tax=Leptolyngbya sp. AN02str TaxID=3423363 RepID=UPI003D310DCA